MKVTSLPDVEPRPRRVAVGTFDGVHLGHREVIRGSDTVLTFDPHPLAVVKPDAAPKLIYSHEIKRDLIAGLGVEELVVIPFDPDFSHKSADEFIDEVLIQKLEATTVSVGENFQFGARAHGNAAMLSARTEFETRVVPLVEVNGETVSSSHIRGLVAAGEVRE
ncbi:MAG TPA: FAD synthetase family protein, partial [Thermoleophilaceae bacterium]|nr:FAD synthetase family protein [Thermoleophilaceae bacterium]